MNPWNLTQAEQKALDALIEHGSAKYAAHKLGKSVRTLEVQLHMAKRRLGARTALQAVIEWDRWRRNDQHAKAA